MLFNSKVAEFTIQGFLIGMIMSFGLFIGVIGTTINILDSNYDITGYNETSLSNYDRYDDLATDINNAKDSSLLVTPDRSVFDFFADIWNKLTSPFKIIIGSYTTFTSLTGEATSTFKLMPIFKEVGITLIVILMIIGVFMIKFYLGRNK